MTDDSPDTAGVMTTQNSTTLHEKMLMMRSTASFVLNLEPKGVLASPLASTNSDDKIHPRVSASSAGMPSDATRGRITQPFRSGSFQNFGATSLWRRPTPCRRSSLSGSQRISVRRSPTCLRCPCRRSLPRYVFMMTSAPPTPIKNSRPDLRQPHDIDQGIPLKGRDNLSPHRPFLSIAETG